MQLTACSTNTKDAKQSETFALANPSQASLNAAQEDPTPLNQTEDQTIVNDSQEFAMGTFILQRVYGKNGEVAIEQALEKVRSLEDLLTFNAPGGDINKLNDNAGKVAVQLDPITIEVIKKAHEVSEWSNGVFDITIGPLVKSWGIGSETERIPSVEEIHNILPLINYRDIEIGLHTGFLKNPGQMVDLGGIAKGYAGDKVIEIYKAQGIQSAFVNLGGNVITLGSKPDGSPWIVGVANPRPEEALDGPREIGVVSVVDKAVVTAGDGERFFVQDGKRYHHILNPHTGYPAQSDLMSVTLITDSSLDADAFDTAVFILGLEKGLDLVQNHGGMEAIFITTDKKIYLTEGLKGNFELLEGSNDYQLIE